jgi:hypothetical protein
MANTPTSKVIFGTETLIDLTGDTAEAGDVLLGKSFHLASGAQGTGTLNPVLKEDIAGVEPSSTASAAHASGTYLYYNNVLYKATADIAQGDSIVTSGASQNVELVTVGGELVALNTSLANQQAAIRENGAHNLLPFNLSDVKAKNTAGTWNGNVYTVGNVTFTVNSDGSVTVNGTNNTGNNITFFVSGSNSVYISLAIASYNSDIVASLGNTDEGIIGLIWGCRNTASDTISTTFEDNTTVSANNQTIYLVGFAIRVLTGKTISNKTFYPMIRVASDKDTAFAPYAMTNTELTKYRLKTLIMSNVTTDNNGRFNIDLPDSNTVVAIYEASGNKIMPYVYDGIWRGMVIDSTGTTVIARTNININVTIKYI